MVNMDQFLSTLDVIFFIKDILFFLDQLDRRFVTAIDFGTTYSGYFFRNCSKELCKTSSFPAIGSGRTLHEKTATTILFNPDKSFNSFG